ncbi:serine/arginine-rich splicing factor 7-like [Orbicella faveolata]|uniref:serine/arginine-rich splicing factor 7-like n=1 Tax=Orbicella faveolata TaxID=48498 RepID=UPI0009E61DD8|nr:serine/arginine-rich splicing factor 7-like [Orbicella faveolata]
MTRVYVGNLGKNGSRRELEREFERFGPLRDVWVARNPPGFAFVLFEDARDAEDACHEMDGKYICGEKVRVEMARGPNRGGRASRMSLKEKCYECGRTGHFARACTRRPGNYSRDRDRGDRRRRSRSRSPRSRSRSPKRQRSGSRSPSPRRRSRSNEDKKSRSRSKSHSKSRSRSRSQSKERAEKGRR